MAALVGCSGSGKPRSAPFAYGNTTEAPDTGQAGTGRTGDIVVPRGTYVHVPGGVRLQLDITNNGTAADQLVRVTSNVGAAAGTLSPDPISIPARGTVHVGTGSVSITLPVKVTLDPGETLALTLDFAKSGHLLMYALVNSS